MYFSSSPAAFWEADSFTGGAKTAILGVALHFLIATGAAAVFYFASREWFFLIEHPIVAGLLYGIPVYAFMNFVVVAAFSSATTPAADVRTHNQPGHSHVLYWLAHRADRAPVRAIDRLLYLEAMPDWFYRTVSQPILFRFREPCFAQTAEPRLRSTRTFAVPAAWGWRRSHSHSPNNFRRNQIAVFSSRKSGLKSWELQR